MFRRNICGASDSAKRRDAVIEEYKIRREPLFVRKDIFVARPLMFELRRAAFLELRSALLRVTRHLPPANTSGLEDALWPGSEIPSDGTSLLLASALGRGSGTRAGQVACMRLSRAAHMK